MIIGDLTGFLLSRLGEDEQDAELFHELACTVQEQQARDGSAAIWCRCLIPNETRVRIQATRAIITACERELREPGGGARGPRRATDRVTKILGSLALIYQQHPRWEEQWRP